MFAQWGSTGGSSN